ncbi:Sodium-dependent dicarboxylate transporter sdcS [Candidatus Nitrosotenuis uzonensis]|uniref:Sodium-dependent dicarboxylate transporter sdcS n=1 Tax=Candidatus Nitrosotenuis uzonensis TaxID=1407055 RepID=A0A812F4J6_9ARCH|nr:Sodium-dependent dicarboxylate transporter sdcS [Candidatus Nitrosotenuis uzonensis]
MVQKSDFKVSSAGFVLGPALFVLILALPIGELAVEAKIVLGLSFWMGIWWIFETVPLYIAAILPLIVFPASGILNFTDTLIFYADKIIFLILGGFFIAAAIERTNLHLRFAFHILTIFGTKPKQVVAAFILITGYLSAWMSNTAATLLVMPLATAILAAVVTKDKPKFAACLMLGIAYAASMGGVATLIGTPPNAIFASLAQSLTDTQISFGKWMLIGMPTSAISLLILWFYITHVGIKLGKDSLFDKHMLTAKLSDLGDLSRDEKLVLAVFIATVTAWLSRGLVWGSYLPQVDDSVISIIAAASLFALPSTKNKQILRWNSAKKIPWGILILIGGGLALAGGFTASGLDTWIATQLGFLAVLPYIVIVIVLLLIVVFTEFISNTATAALMIPIAASLSTIIDINPLLLMVPIAIGASYGFILPVSTPPNAIALSSGYVTAKKMARIGLPLNLIFVLVLAVLTTLLVPSVW